MSLDTALPVQTHQISGTGPYGTQWPYRAGCLGVEILRADGTRYPPDASAYGIVPEEADVSGSVWLTEDLATAEEGATLILTRWTPGEQGWQAGPALREKALEAQLDQMVMTDQELQHLLARSLRVDQAIPPITPKADAVLLWDGEKFVSGPSVADVTGAAGAASRAEAAAAALEGVIFRVPVILYTTAGVQIYDIGYDPGLDHGDVTLNGQALTHGIDYTLAGGLLTLVAPVEQGGDLLSFKGSPSIPYDPNLNRGEFFPSWLALVEHIAANGAQPRTSRALLAERLFKPDALASVTASKPRRSRGVRRSTRHRAPTDADSP